MISTITWPIMNNHLQITWDPCLLTCMHCIRNIHELCWLDQQWTMICKITWHYMTNYRTNYLTNSVHTNFAQFFAQGLPGAGGDVGRLGRQRSLHQGAQISQHWHEGGKDGYFKMRIFLFVWKFLKLRHRQRMVGRKSPQNPDTFSVSCANDILFSQT